MAFQYEDQFRKYNPETIGEADKHFDLDNYKDWLEEIIFEQLECLTEIVNSSDKMIQEGVPTESYYQLINNAENLIMKIRTI